MKLTAVKVRRIADVVNRSGRKEFKRAMAFAKCRILKAAKAGDFEIPVCFAVYCSSPVMKQRVREELERRGFIWRVRGEPGWVDLDAISWDIHEESDDGK